jgi:tRNA U34 5-carboxymethylaminomethyl modifying GTPase MnmE/TrmE
MKSMGKGHSGPPTWRIRNKIDLIKGGKQSNELKSQGIDKSEAIDIPIKSLRSMVNDGLPGKNEQVITRTEFEFNVSALTGEGFGALLSQLARQAEQFLAGSESTLVTRQRHRLALEEVRAALRRAQAPAAAGREDLLAEELRIAARALGRLTGRVDVEDILDVIFRDFCIGK